ncbi:MAG: GDP-mannose 4,6-dehydratase [Candidatus Andersenbacteria bacterium]|nr:GDP-mannose 4,6-dehydratase [Candidatus Andersenbacteria bacterium]
MANFLITGGAGFIGSHTAQKLLDEGHRVTIMDDFNDRYDPRLKEARIKNMFTHCPQHPTIVRQDIRDTEAILRIFTKNKFDSVIHLAAWASVLPSMRNPHIYAQVNVGGTVNILEACRLHGIKNLVFASTSSVYGGLTSIPFHESDNVLQPISPYAATKVAGEVLCATWHNMYQLPVVCLRFFTVYGPWGRPEMAMFQFANAIMAGKPVLMRGHSTKRDFTYIDDVVAGIIGAAHIKKGFTVCNLGEHDAVPLPRLVRALEKNLQKKAIIKEKPLMPGEIEATLADITKAHQLLGYEPTTPIEEGVKKFVDWYLAWYRPNFMDKKQRI